MSEFIEIHVKLTKRQAVELMNNATRKVATGRDYEPFFSPILGAKLMAAASDALAGDSEDNE